MYSLTESPICVPLLCTLYYRITTTSEDKLLIVLFESTLDQAYSTHGNRRKVILLTIPTDVDNIIVMKTVQICESVVEFLRMFGGIGQQ